MSEKIGGVLTQKEIERGLGIAQMVLQDARISKRESHLLANAFKQLYFAAVDRELAVDPSWSIPPEVAPAVLSVPQMDDHK